MRRRPAGTVDRSVKDARTPVRSALRRRRSLPVYQDFPLGTILAGLAVVILAEIFRAGADLQDEQALTI